MPKLTSLTTVKDSWSFRNPRIITLEGISYHSLLTNRHALSHHCCSLQGLCFQQQEENRSYQEFLFLLSFIPRHHSRPPTVPLLSSFFYTLISIIIHTTFVYAHSSIVRQQKGREKACCSTLRIDMSSITLPFPLNINYKQFLK